MTTRHEEELCRLLAGLAIVLAVSARSRSVIGDYEIDTDDPFSSSCPPLSVECGLE